MQKRFMALLIVCVLPFTVCLTSCMNNSDIGIIGGADGPTAILVSGGISDLLNSFDASVQEVPESYNDWFVVDEVIWLNISGVESWKDLELSKGSFYCEITFNTSKKNLSEIAYGSADILPVGTKIFLHTERNDILLAEVNGRLIPYLKIVEG